MRNRALSSRARASNGKLHPKKADVQQILSFPKTGARSSGCTDGQQALCLAALPYRELLEPSPAEL